MDIANYILKIPILFLFKTMKKGLKQIWTSAEDIDNFLNYMADELVENRYVEEVVITRVFQEINVVRYEPSIGECGYRCDGRCKTCLQYNGGGGLDWNASGYND